MNRKVTKYFLTANTSLTGDDVVVTSRKMQQFTECKHFWFKKFEQKQILVGLNHLVQKIGSFCSLDCCIGSGHHRVGWHGLVKMLMQLTTLCRVKKNCHNLSACIKACWEHYQQLLLFSALRY